VGRIHYDATGMQSAATRGDSGYMESGAGNGVGRMHTYIGAMDLV
jgi:hypothetical protein